MKKIKPPSIIDEQNYLFLCKIWDENDDIWVDSSELTISDDIIKYANLAFSFPNKNFTPVILSEIAEKKQTPMALLKKSFYSAIKEPLKVSVCELILMKILNAHAIHLNCNMKRKKYNSYFSLKLTQEKVTA